MVLKAATLKIYSRGHCQNGSCVLFVSSLRRSSNGSIIVVERQPSYCTWGTTARRTSHKKWRPDRQTVLSASILSFAEWLPGWNEDHICLMTARTTYNTPSKLHPFRERHSESLEVHTQTLSTKISDVAAMDII